MIRRISVIGTGYLGATHAACLAELGFEVLGVDNDPDKVGRLGRGELPFSEPGLQELLAHHVSTGRLRFSTSLREAALFADAHFVCVGTPQLGTGLGADTSAVYAVTRGLAEHLHRDCVVIGKSTVPVGTAESLQRVVDEMAPAEVRVRVAWSPEFLREGHAVQDTLRPDRLVFGVADEIAEAVLCEIHAEQIASGTPVHVTDRATAELAKVAANSFLATKISFINAMAEVSERAGADVAALADILGDDPRIGRRFLDAGLGFGGGCLPKDIRAFSARANELGAPAVSRLLHEVDTINLGARQRTIRWATEMVGPRVRGKRIAVLGAAFKPLSDDVRDSPALAVAAHLHLHGAQVRVYDPEASVNARAVCPGATYAANAETALKGADLVMHLTEWPQFRQIDPQHAARLVRRTQLIDGRNKLDHEWWRAAGWTVRALGRGAGETGSRGPSLPAIPLEATGTDLGAAAETTAPLGRGARLRSRLTRA